MQGFWIRLIFWVLAVAAWLAASASGVASGPESGLAPALRAWLSHMLFASFAVATLLTSRAWRAQPAALRDGGFPSMRSLAVATPVVVAIQAGLGTAFHSGVIGVVPHAAWAFLAAMLVMMQATFVLTQADAPGLLKKLSVILLVLVVFQVVLGVAALLVRTSGEGVEAWMTAPLLLHTSAGALIVALTAVTSALTLRHYEPASEANQMASPGRHS